MILNKKLKNFTKSISLIFSAITIPLVSVACQQEHPRAYTVGKEWEIYDLNIKFNSLDYKSTDDYLEIQTTFTFTPLKSEFVLEKDSVFIDNVGGILIKILPNEEKSIETSKFNIFSTMSSKTICVFVFDVPTSLFYNEEGNLKTYSIWFNIDLFKGPDFASFPIDYYNLKNNNK